jgi:hypothetical protein
MEGLGYILTKELLALKPCLPFSLSSYSLLCILFRCLCSTVWNNSRLECKGVTRWNNPACSAIWTVTSTRNGVLLRFCCLQIVGRVLSNGYCRTLTNYYTQIRGVPGECSCWADKPSWTVSLEYNTRYFQIEIIKPNFLYDINPKMYLF